MSTLKLFYDVHSDHMIVFDGVKTYALKRLKTVEQSAIEAFAGYPREKSESKKNDRTCQRCGMPGHRADGKCPRKDVDEEDSGLPKKLEQSTDIDEEEENIK